MTMDERRDKDGGTEGVNDPAFDLITHDLRGILIKINRVSEILREKLRTHKSKETKQLLSFLDSLSNHGIGVTDNLLESFRLEYGDSSALPLLIYSLNKIIREQGKLYQLLAADKKITFTSFVPHKQIYCEIDHYRFIRLLDNLFNNALKFTPEKGKITLSLSAHRKKVLIRLQDTGIGIPHNLHNEIFRKYTRAKRPGIRNEKPTGLGLYIVKQIVNLHGGRIWFESEEEKGTSFFVELERKTKPKS